jgi:hypothetical protein
VVPAWRRDRKEEKDPKGKPTIRDAAAWLDNDEKTPFISVRVFNRPGVMPLDPVETSPSICQGADISNR